MKFVSKLKALHSLLFSSKYLLVTNMFFSVSISATGDMIEQTMERWRGDISEYDRSRTVKLGLSASSVGFICHHWYKWLDKNVPGTGYRIVLVKIILDQVFCSPIYIAAFFLTLGLLEGSSKEQILEDMRYKAWKLYIAEWTLWPIAQYINFTYVPTHYRMLYDNMISLGYGVYTSHITHLNK